MHYVPNIERKDPVIRAIVLHSQRAPGRDLELLLDLQLAHLFESLERYLQFLLLCHSVLEVVPALFEVPLADLEELLLDLDQLVDDSVRLRDLPLEDFDLFWHVLAATSIRGG